MGRALQGAGRGRPRAAAMLQGDDPAHRAGSGAAASSERPGCSAAPRPTSSKCASCRRCPRRPTSCARSASGSACRRARFCSAPARPRLPLKDLSDSGRLADYAILHFATHGALTGQVQGAAEPGLILTPPAKGTSDAKALERDDGYLTASEIAALKLDADWVILSACNTAGGCGENAEALSGLARAFFYAGARALLVSHWEVGSDAAVKLTTGAFAELKPNPRSAAPRPSACPCARWSPTARSPRRTLRVGPVRGGRRGRGAGRRPDDAGDLAGAAAYSQGRQPHRRRQTARRSRRRPRVATGRARSGNRASSICPVRTCPSQSSSLGKLSDDCDLVGRAFLPAAKLWTARLLYLSVTRSPPGLLGTFCRRWRRQRPSACVKTASDLVHRSRAAVTQECAICFADAPSQGLVSPVVV